MKWLGMAVAVVYLPGLTGAAILTQWPMLGVVLPVLMLRCNVGMTSLHWLGLTFLAWATATLFWTENIFDSGEKLWHLIILAMAFGIGSTLSSLKEVTFGLCCGLMVSIVLVFLWHVGVRPFEQATMDAPAGLMITPNVLGSALAIALVGALVYRLWWFIPFGAYGLVSTGFRTGLISVGVAGVAALWFKNRWLALAVGGLCVAAVISLVAIKGSASGGERLSYWAAVLPHLTWHGQGIGSFFQLYPTMAAQLPTRPENLYNDGYQLLFETGLGVLPLAALVICALEAPVNERLILICFLEQSLFFFPLALPISAFMAAVTLGFLAHQRQLHLALRSSRRSATSNGLDCWGDPLGRIRSQALSMESDHPHQAGVYGIGPASLGGVDQVATSGGGK